LRNQERRRPVWRPDIVGVGVEILDRLRCLWNLRIVLIAVGIGVVRGIDLHEDLFARSCTCSLYNSASNVIPAERTRQGIKTKNGKKEWAPFIHMVRCI